MQFFYYFLGSLGYLDCVNSAVFQYQFLVEPSKIVCYVEHHILQQLKLLYLFQAVKQFIDLLSSKQNQPRKVTPETAIQYLSARKFDVPRAVALYEANLAARHREGLLFCDSSVDPLRSELESAKFTVLVSFSCYFCMKKDIHFDTNTISSLNEFLLRFFLNKCICIYAEVKCASFCTNRCHIHECFSVKCIVMVEHKCDFFFILANSR